MPSIVKQKLFEELKEQFEQNPYAFICKFDKATVSDLAGLREALEKVSNRSLVIKHSLARRVFRELNYEAAEAHLNGAVLVTFGDKEPQEISKAIVEYAKANKKFETGGAVFESKVCDEDFVKQLATLPSRDELLTQLVVRVQSPISGFVNTLGQLMRGLVQALSEIQKQREAGPASA